MGSITYNSNSEIVQEVELMAENMPASDYVQYDEEIHNTIRQAVQEFITHQFN